MAPRTQIVAVAVVALLVASTTQAAVTCHSGEPSTGAASDGCEITIGSAPSVFQLGAGTSSVHRFTLVVRAGVLCSPGAYPHVAAAYSPPVPCLCVHGLRLVEMTDQNPSGGAASVCTAIVALAWCLR